MLADHVFQGGDVCQARRFEIAHFKPLPDLRLRNSFFLQSGKSLS